MRAALDAQSPVGVGGVDLEGDRLQTRLLGVGGIEDLDGVVVPLGPAGVHAQEHLGEVGGVHAAGARADGDDGVAGVVLAAEQCADLQVGEVLADGRQVRLGLGEDLGSVLPLLLTGELDHRLEVLDALPQALDPLEVGLGVGQRGGDHLGGVGVIPQVGCGGLLGELGDPGAQGLRVGHRGDGGVGVSESFDLSGEVSGHGGESTAEPARGAVGADSARATARSLPLWPPHLPLTPAQCPGPGRAAPRAPRVSPGPARCGSIGDAPPAGARPARADAPH